MMSKHHLNRKCKAFVTLIFGAVTLGLTACNGITSSQSSVNSCDQNSILEQLDDSEVLIGDMILPVHEVYSYLDLVKHWSSRYSNFNNLKNQGFGTTSPFLSLWNNGVLPIIFESDVNMDLKAKIFAACEKISAVSNVSCVEHTDEAYYVRATTSGTGCFASVGRTVNGVINLEGRCNQEAIIIHELMHNLGVKHEQQHPDRGNFVRVIEENVQAGRLSNFTLVSAGGTITDFDFDSIMIYRSDAFAIGKAYPALVKRSPSCDQIVRTGFPNDCLIPFNRSISLGDAEILSALYGPPGSVPAPAPDPPITQPNPEEPMVCNLTI